MCVDPELSQRHQKRFSRASRPVIQRPWSDIFFIKGLSDTRRRAVERMLRGETLIDRIFPEPEDEPEAFSGEMIADEDLMVLSPAHRLVPDEADVDSEILEVSGIAAVIDELPYGFHVENSGLAA
jgi:hypothetical protein